VTDEMLQKLCFKPLSEIFCPKIRIFVKIPNVVGDKVDYCRGRKYSVILDRMVYRSVKSYIDFLAVKFDLPNQVKLEACLALQS
jgi:hypothetical protein